jgi:hypothetical protein
MLFVQAFQTAATPIPNDPAAPTQAMTRLAISASKPCHAAIQTPPMNPNGLSHAGNDSVST